MTKSEGQKTLHLEKTPPSIPICRPAGEPAHNRLIQKAVSEVIASGSYILGKQLQELEQQIAEFLGVPHAIGCNSGTDALLLSLRASGIGDGDEVITSAFTFIATAEAIIHCQATPVFADIDADYFNLTADRVAPLITPRTKAIIAVHLYGQPAPMEALSQLAKKHGLLLFEDCAQAFGAKLDGDYVGTKSHASTFSFYPTKNLACFGDGGMICCHDDDLAERLYHLRDHGRAHRDNSSGEIGYNSRLDEIQAAILQLQLTQLPHHNQRRQQLADIYQTAFASLPQLTPPKIMARAQHVYHQYTLLHPLRDQLRQALAAQNIASGVFYPLPLNRHPAIATKANESCPNAYNVSQQCLSLPIFPQMSDTEQQRVIAVVEQFCHDVDGKT